MSLLFKKASSAAAMQNDAAKLRTRRGDLTNQLQDARTTLADRQQSLEQMLIGGSSPDDLTMAEAGVADAERRARALAAALTTLDQQIAQREAEIAADADRRAREVSAAELDGDLRDLLPAATALAEAAKKFAAITGKLGLTIWDARELERLAQSIASEIPDAAKRIESATRAHIRQILTGTAPAALRKPDAVPVAMATIPMKRVFTMDRLAWPEGTEVRTVARHQDWELPVDFADRALALGYAVLTTDSRVRALRAGFVAAPPSNACVNLNDPNLQPMRPVWGEDRVKRDAQLAVVTGSTRETFVNAQRNPARSCIPNLEFQ